MLVEAAAHGPSLLGPQVEGLVFLTLVEFSEVLLLSLVDDGEHTGDRFANNSDLGELGGGSTGDFGDAQLRQLHLEVVQLLEQLLLLLAAQVPGLDLGHVGHILYHSNLDGVSCHR